MQRRRFIKTVAAGAAVTPIVRPVSALGMRSSGEADVLIQFWIKENDAAIAKILHQQNRESNHRHEGGFPDQFEIYHAGRAANYVSQLVAGYLSKSSRYYHSDELEQAINRAMTFLLRIQREDGTIDLVTTNFHSPPDTGFVVEPLALALTCVRKYCAGKLPMFQRQCRQFLTAAGKALSIGGVHTPNHRWVVCSALARINSMFPNEMYLKRIDQWLAEGIDIDDDGQYTEQSTSVYSPLVNQCLITMARLLNRPQLYEPVRKNLEMTKYFVRANGEIVTDASKRQDQFRVANAASYYSSYRYMAILDSDGGFAAMAKLIEKTSGRASLTRNLLHFLEDSSLQTDMPVASDLPSSYEKTYPIAKVVRIRRKQTDVTILAENDRWLTLQKGDAALAAVRLASAFFGKGQFAADQLTHDDGIYILEQKLRGPYYQPLAKEFIRGDGDWSKLPKHRRRQSEVQQLHAKIQIRENQGELRIDFDVQGTNHVPLAIELAFRNGGQLSGVEPLEGVDNSFLLKKNQMARYQFGDYAIEFGPGCSNHRWTQLRGALPKLDAQSVYLTAYTPFRAELMIR